MKQTAYKKLLASLLGILCCLHSFAYHPKVKNYPKSLYKAAAQNWAVTQNSSGTMFFANNGGILEFDGRQWSCYQMNNRTNVHHVVALDDKIYAGGANEVGVIETDASDRMVYTSLLDTLNLYASEIWNICKFNGALVFNDNNNIFILREGKTEVCSFKEQIKALISYKGCLFASVTGKGILYYKDGDFQIIPHSEVLQGKTVCRILPYRNNGLLFVTENDGVWKYDHTKTELFEEYNKMTNDKVFCAAFNGRSLAIGTISSGIFVKDYGKNEVLHINSETGLQNNSVLDLFFDKDNNLWAGLNNGIDHIILNSAEKPLFSRPEDYGTGYACMKFDGRLYLGTNQGLFVEEGDSYRKIDRLEGQVWNLQSVDNELFCCHDKGIFIMKQDGHFRHIETDGAWKVQELKYHPGVLLCSSYSRLFTLVHKDGQWQYGGAVRGFDLPSKTFEEDPASGEIWFSHYIRGLFRLTLNEAADSIVAVKYFDEKDGFPTNFNNIPSVVDGRIIFSTEGGFYDFDPETQKAVHNKALNGKFTGTPRVVSIYKTKEGTSYYSSGIMQAVGYINEAGSPVLDSLTLRSLVGRRPLGFDCICSPSPGTFIINTEEGFSQINLNEMEKLGTAPSKVYIKNIKALKQEEEETVYYSRQNNAGKRILKLPWALNSISIDFICPAYIHDEQYEYSYMLKNYDKEFSHFSNTTSKEYTKLPNGKYVFQIVAKDRYSSDSSSDSIEIIIAAPWFKTVYAYIGYFLIFILFILGCLYLAKRIYLMKAREINRRNAEEMQKKELELELEHKAQDIANSTMNVIRKNEILLEIDSNLQKAADYISEDRNKSLRIISKIRYSIKDSIEHDDDWQKFRTNFDLAYSDYLKRLSTAYPSLSTGDQKLCAYLKMGLSSKDMAPLMNMTVRSVEMSRYRLRKKLGMERDDNLVGFLQKF